MKLVDANVLLNAVNASAPDHASARRWLDHALSGGAPVGFAWIVLLAFLRLTTRPGLFERPLTVDQALEVVDGWLEPPAARFVHPTTRHATVLAGLLRGAGTAGNVVNDAHLAALALEHRAQVVTYDSDFGRFPGVRWERPE